MEEMADHIHTASSSMCCCSILLEMKIAGGMTKCFQLWKQDVLQHGYIALSGNCSAFTIIILKQKWSNNLKSSSLTPHGLQAKAVLREIL
jgi:hypothetical protein